jgi:hypothetical protein
MQLPNNLRTLILSMELLIDYQNISTLQMNYVIERMIDCFQILILSYITYYYLQIYIEVQCICVLYNIKMLM